MDNAQNLVGIVAELDRIIEALDGTDTGITSLCLKMARVELQLKIHNVSDQEFDALCDLLRSSSYAKFKGGRRARK